MRFQRLEKGPDLVGGLPVLRRIGRADQDDETGVAAEILDQFVVGALRLVLVAEEIARVVDDVETEGDDKDAGDGADDANDDHQQRPGTHTAGDPAHNVL